MINVYRHHTDLFIYKLSQTPTTFVKDDVTLYHFKKPFLYFPDYISDY